MTRDKADLVGGIVLAGITLATIGGAISATVLGIVFLAIPLWMVVPLLSYVFCNYIRGDVQRGEGNTLAIMGRIERASRDRKGGK